MGPVKADGFSFVTGAGIVLVVSGGLLLVLVDVPQLARKRIIESAKTCFMLVVRILEGGVAKIGPGFLAYFVLSVFNIPLYEFVGANKIPFPQINPGCSDNNEKAGI
jgi:hypothetical protein